MNSERWAVFELVHDSSAQPLAVKDDEGKYIGSGAGHAEGAIRGDLTWSLYEKVSENSCGMYLRGALRRGERETIFEARGFAERTGRSEWSVAGSLRFDDPSIPAPLLWNGRFDENSGRASWNLWKI